MTSYKGGQIGHYASLTSLIVLKAEWKILQRVRIFLTPHPEITQYTQLKVQCSNKPHQTDTNRNMIQFMCASLRIIWKEQ